MKEKIVSFVIKHRTDIITEVPKGAGTLSAVVVGIVIPSVIYSNSKKKPSSKKKNDKNNSSTIPMKNGRIDVKKMK